MTTTAAQPNSLRASFLYTVGLLGAFVFGEWVGQKNIAADGGASVRNAASNITTAVHHQHGVELKPQSATTDDSGQWVGSSKFNIDFDPIDCVTNEYSPLLTKRMGLLRYNSNHSRLQSSMYYMDHAPGDSTAAIMRLVEGVEPTDLFTDLFIDVGANRGMYTLGALALGIPVLGFEPISYNINLLCGSWRENVKAWPDIAKHRFTLIQAAVADETKAAINISKPTMSFGGVDKMDMASLFGNTIGVARRPTIEVETVPMVRLDQVIPDDVSVGFVKIDVQGAEEMVIKGMTGLLSRKTGYPTQVFYEEQKSVVQRANVYTMGANQKYLESFGYTCTKLRNDISCVKPRR